MSSQTLERYFRDPYNYIDTVGGVLSLWTLLYMANPIRSDFQDVLQALTGLLRWVKVIYFLRGFNSTAPLINMLQKIVAGMRSFLILLTVVLVA